MRIAPPSPSTGPTPAPGQATRRAAAVATLALAMALPLTPTARDAGPASHATGHPSTRQAAAPRAGDGPADTWT